MSRDRNWTVLLLGGASGIGKSNIAHALARYYGVSVLGIDDVMEALKVLTTRETLPALHYWGDGADWQEAGVEEKVSWLVHVSREIAPGLKAIVDNHLAEDTPVIIEGDFLHPEWAASFADPRVKALFALEADRDQIVRNYLAREGGGPQCFRADISVAYGEWLGTVCKNLGIPTMEARPWHTVADRAAACLL